MKRILRCFAVLIIVCIAFCCKKDAVPVSDSLVGTWELSLDINGLSGSVTRHKPGNDTLIKFIADSTYTFYEHNKITQSGHYTVRLDTFYAGQTKKRRIIFEGQDSGFGHEFFDISNNQLSFFMDANDSPGVVYRRVK